MVYVFCWFSFESIDDTSTLTSISKVDLFMHYFFPCQVLFVFSSFGYWSLMSVLFFGDWFF